MSVMLSIPGLAGDAANVSWLQTPFFGMQVSLVDSSAAAHGGRHAFLHDFCMVIPYSAIIAAAGLVTLAFGSRAAGVQLLLGGVVMGAAAFSSLRRWKRQLPSRLVTTFAAGAPSCSSRSVFDDSVRVLL